MKKYIIHALCMCSLLQASDSLNQQTLFAKAMDSIGQSAFVHAYSKHVQTKIDDVMHSIQHFGNQPATLNYQELGSQAQYALRIPQKYHLPIQKFNEASPVGAMLPAIAESDAIYVNETNFDKRTYGSQRSSMFHESTHAKYHDSAVFGMIKQVGFWGGTMGTYATLKVCKVVKLRKSLSGTVGLALTSYASIKYKHFMERRADTQGHYATQCSSCVREEMQSRKETLEKQHLACAKLHASCPKLAQLLDKPEFGQGYLTQADLEKIAQDLGDKTCAYHGEYEK